MPLRTKITDNHQQIQDVEIITIDHSSLTEYQVKLGMVTLCKFSLHQPENLIEIKQNIPRHYWRLYKNLELAIFEFAFKYSVDNYYAGNLRITADPSNIRLFFQYNFRVIREQDQCITDYRHLFKKNTITDPKPLGEDFFALWLEIVKKLDHNKNKTPTDDIKAALETDIKKLKSLDFFETAKSIALKTSKLAEEKPELVQDIDLIKAMPFSKSINKILLEAPNTLHLDDMNNLKMDLKPAGIDNFKRMFLEPAIQPAISSVEIKTNPELMKPKATPEPEPVAVAVAVADPGPNLQTQLTALTEKFNTLEQKEKETTEQIKELSKTLLDIHKEQPERVPRNRTRTVGKTSNHAEVALALSKMGLGGPPSI